MHFFWGYGYLNILLKYALHSVQHFMVHSRISKALWVRFSCKNALVKIFHENVICRPLAE